MNDTTDGNAGSGLVVVPDDAEVVVADEPPDFGADDPAFLLGVLVPRARGAAVPTAADALADT